MRKFLIPVVAVVVVAILAVAARLAFFSDHDSSGDVVADPTSAPGASGEPGTTPGASGEPGTTPGAMASPPVAGALPLETLPASAIPWAQVGPGWFLLSYDPDRSDDVEPEWTAFGHGFERWLTLADESLMLVSPAGDLYYVRSLDGLGSVRTMRWLGDSVHILEGRAGAEGGELWHGPLSSLDLATGATSLVNEDVMWFDGPRVLADGRVLTYGSNEGGMWALVSNADYTASQKVCYTSDTDGPIITDLSPDGTRVVCLEEVYPKTAVMLYNVVDGTGTQIDEFTYATWAYTIQGWWDDNSFVLSRFDDATDTNLWWAYNVSTRQIRDLNATLSDGTPAELARGEAGYRVVTAGAIVEVHGLDGVLRASVACDPRAFSGTIALTMCAAPGGETVIGVIDLESGESIPVGSFVQGAEAVLLVYPWPN